MKPTLEQMIAKREERANTETKPFRELAKDAVYEVTELKRIDTKYGSTMILSIDNEEYWTPSSFPKILERENINDTKPFYLAYFGTKDGKEGHHYHCYELYQE